MPSGYSSTAAGGALTQEETAALLVEPLMAEAVVLAAGPRVFTSQGVPLNIPKISALDLADPWRSENTLIAEADPTYSELVLLPSTLKSLKVLHRISNELSRHAVTSIATVLGAALVRRVASAIDRAFLVGDGAANTVLGIANQTGIQTMAAVGAPTVDDLHDALGLGMAANARPSAWFMNPRDLVALRKAKDTAGNYLVHPDPSAPGTFQLLGVPVYVTTQIPTSGGAGTNESRIILADMTQVAVGRDQDVNVTLLEETFADFDQLGIRVTARFDVGLLNAAGVVILGGVTP
jgi:HK97 family phage major capsid protein